MSELHPHWQATDTAAQSIPVHVAERTAPTETATLPRTFATVSRQPAAIAGILLAVSVGVTLFFSMEGGKESTKGNTAALRDEQDVLHAALPIGQEDGVGNPLQATSPEPPSEGALTGTSATGQEEPAIPGSNPFVPLTDQERQAINEEQPAGNDKSPASEESTGKADNDTLIPTNPYTVGSTVQHPSAAAPSTSPPHAGASRPLRQPQTGPALWLVVLGSLGLLFTATRGMLRKTNNITI